MIALECEVCRLPFNVKPYRAHTARFCSKECGGTWHASKRLNSPGSLAERADRMRGNSFRLGLRPARGYAKGQAPWNKDLKGIHLSPGSQFKPGRAPVVPLFEIGAVRIRPDRSGTPRAFVKTAQPGTWRLRAHVAWEAANGPIPARVVIHHVDHVSTNDDPANLRALSRRDHIAEHRAELRAAFRVTPCP